jgi:hypothetical protein
VNRIVKKLTTVSLVPMLAAVLTAPVLAVETAIGDLPTDLSGVRQRLFDIVIGIVAMGALTNFAIGAYQMMVSGDNPDQLLDAKGRMTASILGFIFLLSFVLIIRILGIKILGVAPLESIIK